MFNQKNYIDVFLANYKNHLFTNNSVLRIERELKMPCYQVIGIHKLTPEQNAGKHNLYLDVIDINGKRIPERIEWGWLGQRQNEIANPVILDKPASEPSGNISLGGFQIVWARVLGKPSDTVSNVTTGLPDEGPGNTWGHHSYYVAFLWVETGIPVVPPVIPPPVIPPNPDDANREWFEKGRKSMKEAIIVEINKLK